MQYRFESYELDTGLYELRHQGEACPLEPQVFDVLAYLVENHDRVVPKQELLDHIWPERYITEAALNSRLMAARKAIGDNGSAQRLIKTVHGRGYRFIGEVETPGTGDEPVSSPASTVGGRRDGATGDLLRGVTVAVAEQEPVNLVGREQELDELERLFSLASSGRRQVVFITGEPGLGKTTIVNAFLQRMQVSGAVRVGRGQCLDFRGAGEPYLPVLELLGRICREPGGEQLRDLLSRVAPSWLLQMPWLVGAEEMKALEVRALGTTRDRMLREMMEVVDAFTAERPLILVLEDLHWSDNSTLDLIAALGRRQEPGRLMLVGTYRPADVKVPGHPLGAIQQDLRMRGLCTELALTFFDFESVDRFLESELGPSQHADGIARVMLNRTDGNPLFMRCVLDSWIANGVMEKTDRGWAWCTGADDLAEAVPESLRDLIDTQLSRLDEKDMAILRAAAVAGAEFATAAVAHGVGMEEATVESRCAALAQRGLVLRGAGIAEWQDGTISAAFSFIHDSYREVLYDGIPPGIQARLHRAIGERLESGYEADAPTRATELAMHFRRGRDSARAVRYLRLAAESAIARGAYADAANEVQAAMQILSTRSDIPEQMREEVALLSLLSTALIATDGFSSVEAEQALVRAMELALLVGDRVTYVNLGLSMAALKEYQADHDGAQYVLEQLGLGDAGASPEILRPYNALFSCASFHKGQFGDSVGYGMEGLAVDPSRDSNRAMAYLGEDPDVGCREWSAMALWFLGKPDEALREILGALAVAAEPGRQYAHSSAMNQVARVHHLRREPQPVLELTSRAIELATGQGFLYNVAVGRILHGWAGAMLGDPACIEEIREGIAGHRSTGAEMDRPYYLAILADAHAVHRQYGEALRVLDEALSQSSGHPFFYAAEIYRQKGECLLATGHEAEGEGCLQEALARARMQEARSLELRAAISIARVLDVRGRRAEAIRLLKPVYSGFTEGLETPDLIEASAFLAAQPV